jgi:hypothetical protein
LTLGHIVHAPKRARENARRFRKRVVLRTQIRGKKPRWSVRQSHSVGMMMCVDERTRTHHLTELDGRVSHLIPNPNRDLLYKSQKKSPSIAHFIQSPRKEKKKGHHAHSAQKEYRVRGVGKGCLRGDSRTSLSIFTLALSPSMASSFWPSMSSAKRAPAKAAVSDDVS